MNQPAAAKPPIYFGWYVVAAVTFIAFVHTGSRSSFGIFVIPMSEEFGWSRFTISVVAAIGAIVGGAAQPILGYVFDRIGARKVILTSLVTVGLATAALGLTFNFIFLLLVFTGVRVCRLRIQQRSCSSQGRPVSQMVHPQAGHRSQRQRRRDLRWQLVAGALGHVSDASHRRQLEGNLGCSGAYYFSPGRAPGLLIHS